MSSGTPAAEVEVDADLVRGLLRDQHPELASLPVVPLEAGWDNATFRLGEAWCARLPRREVAGALVVHEQTWLPTLAGALPLPVPAPYRVGAPGRGFPWRWSVVPWIEGVTADREPARADQAEALAAFLAALHRAAPPDAPRNAVRGVPLAARAATVAWRMERLRAGTRAISRGVASVWERALAAPPARERRWLHGDLHPRNVLVREGRLAGVLDWGDLCAGDVATDLASVWMLLAAPAARRRALARYLALCPCDDPEALLARARGWAVFFGVVLLDAGRVDDPRHAATGAATLARIDEDGP